MGGSVKHSAVMGLALLGRQCWGLAGALEGPWGLELWEEWDNRALCRGGWVVYIGGWGWGGGVGGWRGDDFTGGGKLELQVEHCSAPTQGLQVEHRWTSLLPEVGSMAELVLDEIEGCSRPRASRPRCWRHPLRWGAATAGAVALAPVPRANPFLDSR